MNELVKIGLPLFASGVLITLACIYLFGEVWAKGKIVLGDILTFFGWAGKGIRKFGVKSEYEGVINSIIKDYNNGFENPVLPNCKIEWVTCENQSNVLRENEAIICLSFDKKDHNLNFYNATLNFVQTALITKVKDYLEKPSSKAIDLLTTHIILRNNRKEVLTTFRKKFNEFDETTKKEFDILVPTNDRGLFLNILLPEFHFYGELIDTLPPSNEFNVEANGLLTWFKELAGREFDDKTNLKYISKNFKVGVILVGKEETWESQGISAYTKWADYYASENYNSVYVLARGNVGYERATTVVEVLTHSKGFDQLNKKPKIKCVSAEGKEYFVTCYSLRPNKATIAYLAWESLKQYYVNKNEVPAIVDSVQKEGIIINAFGLKFEIPNKQLSEIGITNARNVFQPEDEIFVSIIEFDCDRQHIVLSNIGTSSDPKNYIETILKNDKVYPCTVEKIQTDKQGFQTGLKVSNNELKSWIYIPKRNVTYSRFLDLNLKYSIGDGINVTIEKYNPSISNFIGFIEGLKDPWETEEVDNLEAGNTIKVIVKQINEFYIICEFTEGIECSLARQEISWKSVECNTSKFKVDDEIDARIISIDFNRRKIDISIKRLNKTPELEYFESNYREIVEIEVAYTVPDKGIAVKYIEGSNTGFIWWSEIGWGAVGRFENIYKPGDMIKVIVTEFDAEKNNVRFSIKQKFEHQFHAWISSIDIDASVIGKVIEYFENSVHIEITQNKHTVQAYILKKNISNYAFIENEDLKFYLPIGNNFSFYLLDINEERQTISLTRKEYLEQSSLPNYGEKISVKYVKENHSKGYIYSDDLEGWVKLPDKSIPIGTDVEAMLISSIGEFTIVE